MESVASAALEEETAEETAARPDGALPDAPPAAQEDAAPEPWSEEAETASRPTDPEPPLDALHNKAQPSYQQVFEDNVAQLVAAQKAVWEAPRQFRYAVRSPDYPDALDGLPHKSSEEFWAACRSGTKESVLLETPTKGRQLRVHTRTLEGTLVTSGTDVSGTSVHLSLTAKSEKALSKTERRHPVIRKLERTFANGLPLKLRPMDEAVLREAVSGDFYETVVEQPMDPEGSERRATPRATVVPSRSTPSALRKKKLILFLPLSLLSVKRVLKSSSRAYLMKDVASVERAVKEALAGAAEFLQMLERNPRLITDPRFCADMERTLESTGTSFVEEMEEEEEEETPPMAPAATPPTSQLPSLNEPILNGPGLSDSSEEPARQPSGSESFGPGAELGEDEAFAGQPQEPLRTSTPVEDREEHNPATGPADHNDSEPDNSQDTDEGTTEAAVPSDRGLPDALQEPRGQPRGDRLATSSPATHREPQPEPSAPKRKRRPSPTESPRTPKSPRKEPRQEPHQEAAEEEPSQEPHQEAVEEEPRQEAPEEEPRQQAPEEEPRQEPRKEAPEEAAEEVAPQPAEEAAAVERAEAEALREIFAVGKPLIRKASPTLGQLLRSLVPAAHRPTFRQLDGVCQAIWWRRGVQGFMNLAWFLRFPQLLREKVESLRESEDQERKFKLLCERLGGALEVLPEAARSEEAGPVLAELCRDVVRALDEALAEADAGLFSLFHCRLLDAIQGDIREMGEQLEKILDGAEARNDAQDADGSFEYA